MSAVGILEYVERHGWPAKQRDLCDALGICKQTVSKNMARLRGWGVETPKYRRGRIACRPRYPHACSKVIADTRTEAHISNSSSQDLELTQ